MSLEIVSFYKFVKLTDLETLQKCLLEICKGHNIKGTILLAEEGINLNLAGEKEVINEVINYLQKQSYFSDLNITKREIEVNPFRRMKVKIKPEIITFNEVKANPSEKNGIYISPKDWNNLISNSDVTVIDTRNDYEVNIGTFKGAKNPHIDSFTEFKDYIKEELNPNQNKKVAVFCTGGIRCEKVTSLMLNEGFEEVYHLKGGILKYLEEIPADESLWEGECFVFDERVAVTHGLAVGNYQLCPNCGVPISIDATDNDHLCK